MEQDKEKTEHEKFLELCEYVRFEILEIPLECKFPRNLALRLRGLHDGKFMANNNQLPMAYYDYDVILLTFKIHKYDILSKIRKTDSFKDQNHKINYMMAIIESKINDVVQKVKKVETNKQKVENKELYNHDAAEYKQKTKKVKSNKLNDLW